jgi:hypothetical protein
MWGTTFRMRFTDFTFRRAFLDVVITSLRQPRDAPHPELVPHRYK